MARGFLFAMSILAIIVLPVCWPLSLCLVGIVLVAGLITPGNGLIGVCLSLSIIVVLILLLLLMAMIM